MLNAERLNADCACTTLDRDRLAIALQDLVGDRAFCDHLLATKPNLLSPQPVYLAADHVAAIRSAVSALDAVMGMPAWTTAVLNNAAPLARIDRGTAGVFMGYDFHISADGPRLIEINTNAGGALINAVLLAAQQVCCSDMAGIRPLSRDAAALRDRFVAMFRQEWQRAGRTTPLRSIAIVDAAPAEQYLYEEFQLFQRLFEAHGLVACIADPAELTFRDGALWAGDARIDMVYNRLTDFALTGPDVSSLKAAYQADAVVLTPSPFHHATRADKRLLATLSDASALTELGVTEGAACDIARFVPPTRRVDPADATALWSARNKLFFKPVAGFGGKAAYRGDKLTRATFDAILAGDYVAQTIVPPSTRVANIDGVRTSLKLDVRAYAYAGEVLLFAARLYQGQTTNFRTTGGGWAPVFGTVSEQ